MPSWLMEENIWPWGRIFQRSLGIPPDHNHHILAIATQRRKKKTTTRKENHSVLTSCCGENRRARKLAGERGERLCLRFMVADGLCCIFWL